MAVERKRWEYTIGVDGWDVTSLDAVRANREQASASLNRVGDMDWELVSVETIAEKDGKAVLVYFFKRPVQ